MLRVSRKNRMLVCWWWWFDWSFARFIAPVVQLSPQPPCSFASTGTGWPRFTWKMAVKTEYIIWNTRRVFFFYFGDLKYIKYTTTNEYEIYDHWYLRNRNSRLEIMFTLSGDANQHRLYVVTVTLILEVLLNPKSVGFDTLSTVSSHSNQD